MKLLVSRPSGVASSASSHHQRLNAPRTHALLAHYSPQHHPHHRSPFLRPTRSQSAVVTRFKWGRKSRKDESLPPIVLPQEELISPSQPPVDAAAAEQSSRADIGAPPTAEQSKPRRAPPNPWQLSEQELYEKILHDDLTTQQDKSRYPSVPSASGDLAAPPQGTAARDPAQQTAPPIAFYTPQDKQGESAYPRTRAAAPVFRALQDELARGAQADEQSYPPHAFRALQNELMRGNDTAESPAAQAQPATSTPEQKYPRIPSQTEVDTAAQGQPQAQPQGQTQAQSASYPALQQRYGQASWQAQDERQLRRDQEQELQRLKEQLQQKQHELQEQRKQQAELQELAEFSGLYDSQNQQQQGPDSQGSAQGSGGAGPQGQQGSKQQGTTQQGQEGTQQGQQYGQGSQPQFPSAYPTPQQQQGSGQQQSYPQYYQQQQSRYQQGRQPQQPQQPQQPPRGSLQQRQAGGGQDKNGSENPIIAVTPASPRDVSRTLDREDRYSNTITHSDVAPLYGVPGSTPPSALHTGIAGAAYPAPAVPPVAAPQYPPVAGAVATPPHVPGVLPGAGVTATGYGGVGTGLAGATTSPYVTLHTNVGFTEAGHALGVKTAALASGPQSLVTGLIVSPVWGYVAAGVGLATAALSVGTLAANTHAMQLFFPSVSVYEEPAARYLLMQWGAALLPLASAAISIQGVVSSGMVGTEGSARLTSSVLVGFSLILLVTLQAVSLRHLPLDGLVGGVAFIGAVVSAWLLTRTINRSWLRSALISVWTCLTPRSLPSFAYTLIALGLTGTGLSLLMCSAPGWPAVLLGGPFSFPHIHTVAQTLTEGGGLADALAALFQRTPPDTVTLARAVEMSGMPAAGPLAVFAGRAVGAAFVASGLVSGFLSGAADRLLLATSPAKLLNASLAAGATLFTLATAAGLMGRYIQPSASLIVLLVGQVAVAAWAATITAKPATLQGASRLVVGGHHLQLQVSQREPPSYSMSTTQFWEAMAAPREEF